MPSFLKVCLDMKTNSFSWGGLSVESLGCCDTLKLGKGGGQRAAFKARGLSKPEGRGKDLSEQRH